jgi:hypothetical protein
LEEVVFVCVDEEANAAVEFEGLDDESVVEFAQAVLDRGLVE